MLSTGAVKLRQLIKSRGIIVAPGAFDAISALVVEKAGFPCVYLSGANNATAMLGVPDIGLVTLTEILTTANNVVSVIDLPVIVDADQGYGNPINTMRAIRELERAGAAAIQLEDQPFPKRCGHFDDKTVVSCDEMVMKIRAAIEARRNPDTVLIARTDARTPLGLNEAMHRAVKYAEAGADIIFVESPRTLDELARIAKEVPAPTLANMVEGGKTPFLKPEQLEQLGFKIAIYPASTMRASMRAMRRVLRELAEKGTTEALWDDMADWNERQEIVNLSMYKELEHKFTYTGG